MTKLFKAAAIALPTFTMAGVAGAADIVDTVAGAGSLHTLAAAVEAAGLAETLKGEGPFVVFAPTDQALEEEGSAVLLDGVYRSPLNRSRLVDLISYHVVPSVAAGDGSPTRYAEMATLSGATIEVRSSDGRMLINGHIEVVDTISADNGVIHLVSGLLWPAEESGWELADAR